MREPPMRPPSLMNSHRCKRIPETEDEQKKKRRLVGIWYRTPEGEGNSKKVKFAKIVRASPVQVRPIPIRVNAMMVLRENADVRPS